MGFLSRAELKGLGFATLGENVLISDKASIYSPERISLGSHVRIDDFCILSAGQDGIQLGNFIHIAVFSLLIGAAKITMDDFSGLSSRVSIYSSNDDYSGRFMTNPTVPSQFTGVTHSPVYLEKHVIVGSGSIVLPGVTLEEGAAIGSLSLVKSSCSPYTVYMGVPAEPIGRRRDRLKEQEARLRLEFSHLYPETS